MKLILETKRLIIRETNIDDAESIFDLHTNKDVQQYTGEPMPLSLQEVQEGLHKHAEENFVKRGFGRWAVIHKSHNKLIGWSGLKYLTEFDEIDLGYRFFPEYWGMGIATETAIPIVKYGFEILNLNRIIGIAMKENIASINVLKKAGMTFDKCAPYEEGSVSVEWYSVEKTV
ncbi:MAG: GNAT family N-acetyltransferase [Saprospiraceae bacterium]|nr:GNAT family N-acetyltransferase [Saprospiraceae bacterium]